MAPSPENDSPPKAPDKEDKSGASNGPSSDHKPTDTKSDNKETDLEKMDENGLKHLLDEAYSYKCPKDREGKSELFKNLLTNAENELRNLRATSASGPETVRHYNKRAPKRQGKGRKSNSISENYTLSGSLDDLNKEALYEGTKRQLPKKSVSARQKEGGSLPCNVNAGACFDRKYIEDFQNIKEIKDIKRFVSNVSDDPVGAMKPKPHTKQDETSVMEALRSVDEKIKKTGKFGVDDGIVVPSLEQLPFVDIENCRIEPSKGPGLLPVNVPNLQFANVSGRNAERRVDENCNAVPQHAADGKKSKTKKKKEEKNVTVWDPSELSGHRSDIIDDVDKLTDYIDGNNMQKEKTKNNLPKPQKNMQRNSSSSFVDGDKSNNGSAKDGKKKKQEATRTSSSASASTKPKGSPSLQKSSSLEEMSTTKMDEFSFASSSESGGVHLRQSKSSTERPRERRSWGTSEPIQVQNLYTNASAENLESSADFRVVTKKKKSKKQQRRNSLSGRRQQYRVLDDDPTSDFNRVPSLERRRKPAVSVPHSERSNDSSDVDSVHSLPIDAVDRRGASGLPAEDVPISYADIARHSAAATLDRPGKGKSERPKARTPEKQLSVEETMKVVEEKKRTDELKKLEETKRLEELKKLEDLKRTEENKRLEDTKRLEELKKIDELRNLEEIRKTEETKKTKKNVVPDLNPANFPSIPSKDKHHPETKHTRNPIAEIQTWPAIPNNRPNIVKNNNNNNVRVQKNHVNKNSRNNAFKGVDKPLNNNNNNNFPINSGTETIIYSIPLNIPDVQQIEKQLKSGHVFDPEAANRWFARINKDAAVAEKSAVRCADESAVRCADERAADRTSAGADGGCCEDGRPAVVILSGSGGKEVSGITFGFDINEQLLSDDVCADFATRFAQPVDGEDARRCFNYDRIVNFIGSAWEDTMRDPDVQFFSDRS